MMFCPRSLSSINKWVVLGFTILSAIVLPMPSAAADKVRVAFSAVAPSQGVLWVADVGGLLNKNGISAEIIYTRAAIETLVAGEVDFAQMTGSLMSSARLQGADPVMIASAQDTLDDYLVARPNIKSIEDLRGKRIGVFRFGAASHLRLIYVLPRYGLSERDVTLLQVGDSPDRLIALSGGAIDATLISPPDHLEALRMGISMVHQELLPFPDLSVAENICMGREPTRWFPGWLDRTATVGSLLGVFVLLLAGGVGSRLCLLSERRAKPAVPFAGKYRIIDFTLSNCVNSGIFDVGILTQYRPHSLNAHIGNGKPWDLDRSQGGVELLQPYQGRRDEAAHALTIRRNPKKRAAL